MSPCILYSLSCFSFPISHFSISDIPLFWHGFPSSRISRLSFVVSQADGFILDSRPIPLHYRVAAVYDGQMKKVTCGGGDGHNQERIAGSMEAQWITNRVSFHWFFLVHFSEIRAWGRALSSSLAYGFRLCWPRLCMSSNNRSIDNPISCLGYVGLYFDFLLMIERFIRAGLCGRRSLSSICPVFPFSFWTNWNPMLPLMWMSQAMILPVKSGDDVWGGAPEPHRFA